MSTTAPRRGAILAAACLSVFAINIDTTIINVALPSLTRELGAGTTDLQWIVDGYSLSFAALVLAAGSLGDRYGRRLALVAAGAVSLVVPESRDPAAPPLHRPGLLTASVAVGSLVYTIIEAPSRGWGSTATFVGFAVTILSGIAFVLIERDSPHPMLDVSLFGERAFSAASGSVTVAFFSLFGFIFLMSSAASTPRYTSRSWPRVHATSRAQRWGSPRAR